MMGKNEDAKRELKKALAMPNREADDARIKTPRPSDSRRDLTDQKSADFQ